jgi:hypothetical protein
MPGIGRQHEQVDLLVTDVIPIELRSVAQHVLQFALDGWKERFVCQGLTPELDYELEVHSGFGLRVELSAARANTLRFIVVVSPFVFVRGNYCETRFGQDTFILLPPE